MPYLFRILTIVLMVMASLAAVTQAPAHAQGTAPPPKAGAGLALDLFDQLDWTRAGADRITKNMSLIQFEDEYCLPPDQPNKDQEEAFLESSRQALAEYRARYNKLRPQFIKLISNDSTALKAVLQKMPAGANPISDSFWQPWPEAFAKAAKAIEDKKKELDSKKVKRCRPPPPPPPPPPQTDPGVPLPQVTVRPVETPAIPGRFCSAAEKQAAIDAFLAVGWDYYMNYQDAREFHDAIEQALAKGQGNADVLRSMLPKAKTNLDLHAKRLDEFHQALARVRAMPVVDCGVAPPPPPPPPPGDFPQPDYEKFLPPGVPDRFCSEEEKQATLNLLDAAKKVARRNYEKAKAHVADLDRRLKGGDRTPGLAEALHDARQAETNFYNQWIELDRAYYKAQAMPVQKCDRTETGGAAFNFEAGFKQADRPQLWIGRTVLGGDDSPLVRTPETLNGFFAAANVEVLRTSGQPLYGDSASFAFEMYYSGVEDDQRAVVDTPPGGSTGYLFIDPTDPGRPVGGTGLATGFGSWDTHVSAEQRTFQAAALYREFLGRDVAFGAGVLVRAQDVELTGSQSHLSVPGLTATERHDISTVDVGAMFEALLRRDTSGVSLEASVFVAPVHEARDYEAVQRTTAPAPFSFDFVQRRDFDDDGFNLLYGVNASIGVEVLNGHRLSLVAGWQGETDAATVRPADGSAPGAPIGPDTESASEWYVGLRLGGPLN